MWFLWMAGIPVAWALVMRSDHLMVYDDPDDMFLVFAGTVALIPALLWPVTLGMAVVFRIVLAAARLVRGGHA